MGYSLEYDYNCLNFSGNSLTLQRGRILTKAGDKEPFHNPTIQGYPRVSIGSGWRFLTPAWESVRRVTQALIKLTMRVWEVSIGKFEAEIRSKRSAVIIPTSHSCQNRQFIPYRWTVGGLLCCLSVSLMVAMTIQP